MRDGRLKEEVRTLSFCFYFCSRSFLKSIQVGKNLVAMMRRVHPSIDLRHFSVRVDDEGIAGRDLHHGQVRERAVSPRDALAVIGQQLEVQSFFRAELFMRLHAVEAHAQHHRVALGKFRLVDLKIVRFPRASRSLVLRIKVEHHPLSSIILEARSGTLLRGEREIGSGAAYSRQRGARKQSRNQKNHPDYDQQQQHDLQHTNLRILLKKRPLRAAGMDSKSEMKGTESFRQQKSSRLHMIKRCA